MTNVEARRNDEIRMSKNSAVSFRHLSIRASFVIRHSCFVISRIGSLQAPRALPQLREKRTLLHGAYSPLDASASMQRSKRLGRRFHERHALGVPVALRLGMPDVGVGGDDQAEARISGPEAVIVFLPIAAWEPVGVKKTKPLDHFTRAAEDEPVN